MDYLATYGVIALLIALGVLAIVLYVRRLAYLDRNRQGSIDARPSRSVEELVSNVSGLQASEIEDAQAKWAEIARLLGVSPSKLRPEDTLDGSLRQHKELDLVSEDYISDLWEWVEGQQRRGASPPSSTLLTLSDLVTYLVRSDAELRA